MRKGRTNWNLTLICSGALPGTKEKRAKLFRFALFFLTVNLKKRSLHLLSGYTNYFKYAKMHGNLHLFADKRTGFFILKKGAKNLFFK